MDTESTTDVEDLPPERDESAEIAAEDARTMQLTGTWVPAAGALAAVCVFFAAVAHDTTSAMSAVIIAICVLLTSVVQLAKLMPAVAPLAVLAVMVVSEKAKGHLRDAVLLAVAGAVAAGCAAMIARRQHNLRTALTDAADAARRRQVRDAVNDALAQRRRANYVEREFVRAQRYGREVTVAVAAIDNLDLLLRERGPDATMDVLVKLGELFSADSRLPDGGLSDELKLVFVLPETPLQGGRVVAERVRLGFQALRLRGADDVPFTVSIGVASYPADGQRAAEITEAAHDALRRAIAAGGNRTMLSRSLAGMPPGWSGRTGS
jgi:diguanylate cyclase (GGDEF)-like protein